MTQTLKARPALAAALVYAVLSVAMVAPGLMPGKTLSNSDFLQFEPPWEGVRPAALRLPSNSELGDAPGQLQPFLRYAADRMPHVPLWNPYTAAGRPFLANAQSAIFSPYSLPAYVLPFWTALPIIAVLKLWVAAFGMFLLGRALGMRFGGALMAGVVYAFSLWMVTWISYPHMSVWTWIPWMLLLTEQLIRRPDLVTGGGLAAVMGVQLLGGHPESSFHALLATVAFFVMRLWQTRRDVLPTTLVFGAALAGGAALSAAVMFPFGELLWHSADLHSRGGTSVDQHISREFILGIALPDYWGRPTATPIKPFLLNRAVYAGALPLMLAAAALVLRPRFERVCVALFGGLWLAVVFGIPPFLQIVTRLPVFSSGHNSRLIVLYMLALALLAGWGMDDLIEGRWRERGRNITLALAGAMLVLPALFIVAARRTTFDAVGEAIKVAWAFANPPGVYLNPNGGRACIDQCIHPGNVVRLSSLIVWLTVAGAGVLLLWLRFNRRVATTAFVTAAILIVCVDLFRAGVGYNPAIDRDYATPPATGAIRYLERYQRSRFVSMEPVPQNVTPLLFKLPEARGYDFPIIRRYDTYWRRELSPESPSLARGLIDVALSLRNITPQSVRALRQLSVTHLMQDPRQPPLKLAGLRLVYEGADARVYRVVGALPRAFVVPVQRVVSGGDAALAAVTGGGFDGRRVAVTERRVSGVPVSGSGSGSVGRVSVYEPERVVVRARGSGLLVLSDNWFPGWKAKVDGKSTPVERVDYLFRGVRLGPGEHTVEFSYRPLSWRLGWIVSLISLAALALALTIGVRRVSAERQPEAEA